MGWREVKNLTDAPEIGDKLQATVIISAKPLKNPRQPRAPRIDTIKAQQQMERRVTG